jgi:hypothetical protein
MLSHTIPDVVDPLPADTAFAPIDGAGTRMAISMATSRKRGHARHAHGPGLYSLSTQSLSCHTRTR